MNGSGRARCVICNKNIAKGRYNQIVAETYQSSARCHVDCVVNWEKVGILKALSPENDKDDEDEETE